MKVDLHNHTYLCKHAVGIMADYVQKAIDEKIDVFGFSDHNPMKFDKRHRMEDKYEVDYLEMFTDVKKQFDGQIKLLFAYEFDYLTKGMNLKDLKKSVDYLIGSVHNVDIFALGDEKIKQAYINEHEMFKNKDADYLWMNYFEQIKNMAQSGHFNIVGHMDFIKLLVKEPKTDVRLLAKEALTAIKKSGMSVEINAAGLRNDLGETYPSKKLLEEVYACDIPITFGSDSHNPKHVGFKKNDCENLAKEIGYTKCVYYEKKEKIIVEF